MFHSDVNNRLEAALKKLETSVAYSYGQPKFDGRLAAGSYSIDPGYSNNTGYVPASSAATYNSQATYELDLAQKVHDHAEHYVRSVTDDGRRGTIVHYHNRGGVWLLDIDNGNQISYVSPYASSQSYGVVEKALQITFDGIMRRHRDEYIMRRQTTTRPQDYIVNEKVLPSMRYGYGDLPDMDAPRYKKPEINYDSSERTAVEKSKMGFFTCEVCNKLLGVGSGYCTGVINFLGRCPTKDKSLWDSVRKLYWHRYAQQKKELALV